MTTSPTRTTFGEMEGGGTIMETVESEEEVPHARGPEVIGMEDTGPQKQGTMDIEGAIGRPSVDQNKSPGPTASAEGAVKEGDENEKSEEAEKVKENDKAKEEGEGVEDVEMKSDV
jgi:hypothetical protein